MGRNRVIVAAASALSVLVAAAAHAQDPFGGVTRAVTSNAQTWAAVLMILGALGVGGRFMLGSHGSGEAARNWLFGSLFLILAGIGLGIYAKVQSLLGGGL